jgi:hypothetical protein
MGFHLSPAKNRAMRDKIERAAYSAFVGSALAGQNQRSPRLPDLTRRFAPLECARALRQTYDEAAKPSGQWGEVPIVTGVY